MNSAYSFVAYLNKTDHLATATDEALIEVAKVYGVSEVKRPRMHLPHAEAEERRPVVTFNDGSQATWGFEDDTWLHAYLVKMAPGQRVMWDNKRRALMRYEVEQLVAGNLKASNELGDPHRMKEAELKQWATDEEGNFDDDQVAAYNFVFLTDVNKLKRTKNEHNR